ncbi:MAG: hypothetical protein K5634_02745 [Sphaerochaetaceae bacterium]|nr:hypothetical protein [Sphaerochaetaceae bacterium]
MKRLCYLCIILLILMLAGSCDNNVYISDKDSYGLWKVGEKSFASLQGAVDYICSAKDSDEMTAVLQKDVTDGKRGGGMKVPQSFSGSFTVDFNGHTYEFDSSLLHFFEVNGGEVCIKNGVSVIHNDASHEPYALSVNYGSVTLDNHLIDDRRVKEGETESDSNLILAMEKGSVTVKDVQAQTDEEENESCVLTGIINIVTDGQSGGKVSIESSRVTVTCLYTGYRDSSTGELTDEIPETVEISSDARAQFIQKGGFLILDDIRKTSDFYNCGNFFSKAMLRVIPHGESTKIDTLHQHQEVHDAIEEIINNSSESSGVIHNYYHEMGEWITVKEPTCEEEGIEKRSCTRGCTSGENGGPYTETRPIPATGHDFSCDWQTNGSHHWKICLNDSTHVDGFAPHSVDSWTYDLDSHTDSGVCSVCGIHLLIDHVHELVHHEAVPHTSDAEGNIEYWSCTGCGRKYLDQWARYETNDVKDHHQFVYHAAVPHTCTSEGSIEYHECSVCGLKFSGGQTVTDEEIKIPMAPHTPDVLTAVSNGHYRKCLVCNQHLDSEGNVIAGNGFEDHTMVLVDNHATHHFMMCSVCGYRENEEEHSYGQWYVEGDYHSKTCTVCGHIHSEPLLLSHNLVHTAAASATCESSGNIEYWQCSICNLVYSDEQAQHEIDLSDTVIPATRHSGTIEFHARQEATCTENGNIDYWHCTSCGKYFTEVANGEYTGEITQSQTVISPSGHEWGEWITTVSATCTETGVETRSCLRCGVTESRETAATGHDWSEHWSSDDSSHWHVCKNDSSHITSHADHSVSEWNYNSTRNIDYGSCDVCGRQVERVHVHELSHVAAIAHTSTTDGNIEHWHCSICGKNYIDETGAIEVSDIKDPHQLVHHPAVSHTCTMEGSIEYYQCSVCGLKFSNGHTVTDEEITIPMAPHTIDAWSSDQNGHYRICSSCNNHIDSEGQIIPESGYESHTLSLVNTHATHHFMECSVCGYRENEVEHTYGPWFVEGDYHSRTCTVCGYTHSAPLAISHDLVHTAATSATCESNGNIEYWQCSKCNLIYSDEQAQHEIDLSDTVIPATRHSGTIEFHARQEAACTENGNIDYWYCTSCGKYFTDVVNGEYTGEITQSQTVITAAGHQWSEAWSHDSEYHWHECLRCGEITDKSEHDYEIVFVSDIAHRSVAINTVCSVCSVHQSNVITSSTGAFDINMAIGFNVARTGANTWTVSIKDSVLNSNAGNSCSWFCQAGVLSGLTGTDPVTVTIDDSVSSGSYQVRCEFTDSNGMLRDGCILQLKK